MTRQIPSECELKEREEVECRKKPEYSVGFSDLSPIYVCKDHLHFFQKKWKVYKKKIEAHRL